MPSSALSPNLQNNDRAALQKLYNETGGQNWKRSDNWLTTAPLNQWYGVWTDETGRVTEILMRDNGLTGKLPSEIGNLTSLQVLDLPHNRLSGQVPTEMAHLTEIRHLSLWQNNMSGPFPKEVLNMPNLEFLSLGFNGFTGDIPPELGQLRHLLKLEIPSNQFSGTIPPELGNLSNLLAFESGYEPTYWSHSTGVGSSV